jgi:hypothetical protein
MKQVILAVLLILLAITFSGCSSNQSHFEVVPIKGTVVRINQYSDAAMIVVQFPDRSTTALCIIGYPPIYEGQNIDIGIAERSGVEHETAINGKSCNDIMWMSTVQK